MAERGIKWIIRRPTYGTHAASSHLRRNPRFITRRSEGQRVYSPVPIASFPLSSLLPQLLFIAATIVAAPCPGRAIAFDTVVCPLSARLTIAGLIKRQSMLAPCQEFLVFKSPTYFQENCRVFDEFTACLLSGKIWKIWNFQGIFLLLLKIGNFHGFLSILREIF